MQRHGKGTRREETRESEGSREIHVQWTMVRRSPLSFCMRAHATAATRAHMPLFNPGPRGAVSGRPKRKPEERGTEEKGEGESESLFQAQPLMLGGAQHAGGMRSV